MKKKPKPTPEEIAAKEEMKVFSKRFNAHKAKLKAICASQGLRIIELQLEFIKLNPKTPLPKEYFDHA